MTITIGIDPRNASHTAVAIDNTEHVLDEIRVRGRAGPRRPISCVAGRHRSRCWRNRPALCEVGIP